MAHLSVWAFVSVIVVLVIGTLLLGFHVGNRRHKAHPDTPEGPVAAVVASVLGLLAFMLAFTFSLASDRYAARKQLLLDEVNSISVLARRADMLPDAQRAEYRKLLKEYVADRIHVVEHIEDLPRVLQRSEVIHDQLWAQAMALPPDILNADIGNLIVDANNRLVELHRERVTIAVQYRIPGMVWSALMVLLAMSMLGVGYQFGITGRHNLLVSVIMALSFAVVLGLIYGLDDPTGQVKVDQRPMVQLQKELERQGH